ncbi:DUF2142 domain-containing protein [Leifsonia sp. fls2-241-R2A-40a]|uniref:DUF2142 domain-containing protein n=1 Tax=Leifsonia sp. fls2-241-R2A-40a TaxID=3040290 RepID=UPI00254AE6C4|nr:DUF2142 domain-containing protein [Leifsonia sp. fls2-241-R2A-40a]
MSSAARFPGRLFASVFAVLFVIMGAWSLATPVYAVPDEASHTVRAAAAAHGQIVGDGRHFQAPGYLYIPGAGSCFAGRPDKTPACVGTSPYGSELRDTISTAQTNSPVYYVIVGLPTLVLSGLPAFFGMRLLSAALVAAFFAATAVLLRRLPGARWTLLVPLATVTPEVVFLGGAINPNAVEMAAAGALFASLLVLARVRPSGWSFGFAAATAVASTALVTGGRSLGLLWVVVAGAGVLALLRRDDWRALSRRTSTWVVLAALAVIGAAQLFWFTRPGNGVQGQAHPTPGSLVTVAQNMVENTFVYWRQLTGQFGTVDVPAPEGVQTLWTAMFLAIIVLPLVLGRGRERWVAAGFTAVLLIVPIATQVALWRQVGDVWQGRYMLAVLLLIAIAGGLALDAAGRPLTRASVDVVRTLVVLLAIGLFSAFAFTLRRYAVTDNSWVRFLLDPQWQPPGGTILLTLLTIAALAFGVIAVWRALPRLAVRQGAIQGGAAVGTAFDSGSHRNS